MASRAQPGLLRETVKAGAVRGGALIAAIALFLATLLMVLALASYRASDAALNTASGGPVQNLAGVPGAWFADLALTLFGPAVACRCRSRRSSPPDCGATSPPAAGWRCCATRRSASR
jgi:S-DNA-T family DNA segregation ATPase FtsK/SpoIIIE